MAEVVITAADIEDTSILAGSNSAKNYGGGTKLFVGASNDKRVLIRVKTSAIPEGTITAAVLTIYTNFQNLTMSHYRVPDADSDWVEGTYNGGAVSGLACWDQKAYLESDWTVTGCGLVEDGTEFDHPYEAGDPGLRDVDLPVEWFQGWKDGDFGNGGFIITNSAAGTNFESTEDGVPGNRPYVTITYAESSSGQALSIKSPTVSPISKLIKRVAR